MPGHRHLTKRQALRAFPSLRKDALVGAVQYYDGQVDDARHTMMVARTAAQYGALCATSTRVTGFLREGDRVVGARVRDLETGTEHEIRARRTINAAGVWTDEIQDMVGGRGQFNVRASKGVHVVVPRDRIQATTGIISRTEKSVLFIIPWDLHWIIGTTDTDWDLDLAHPAASRSDIDYLLGHANRLLRTPLTHEDIVGVYAGLRPLLQGESEATSKLSREHAVASPVAGLVVVAGGKYTTYRVMAKDAVDAAVESLPSKVPPSRTERVPLVGAEGFTAAWNQRHVRAQRAGLHVAWLEHLLRRYGSLTEEVLELVASEPDAGTTARRGPHLPAGRGRLRGARTRAPCTSTTSSPAGPGSRSRPPTAAGRARATSPTSWRRCWAGTRRRRLVRSRTTGPGSTPSSSRRRRSTTALPMPPGSARPTCAATAWRRPVARE